MKMSNSIRASESYYKMCYKEEVGCVCLIPRLRGEPMRDLLQKSRKEMRILRL